MKFIFQQNYNFNSKILCIIEYSSILLDIVWAIFLWIILSLNFVTLNIKIFLFIILFFPVFIFSIVGINGENILYVISYVFKYCLKQKIIIYEKNVEFDCKNTQKVI